MKVLALCLCIMSESLVQPPDFRWTSVQRYFASRFTTLKPPPFSESAHRVNPIPALRQITGKQWLFILVAFLGWTWDAFDFFSVSLTATSIAGSLNSSVSQISWGITLV